MSRVEILSGGRDLSKKRQVFAEDIPFDVIAQNLKRASRIPPERQNVISNYQTLTDAELYQALVGDSQQEDTQPTQKEIQAKIDFSTLEVLYESGESSLLPFEYRAKVRGHQKKPKASADQSGVVPVYTIADASKETNKLFFGSTAAPTVEEVHEEYRPEPKIERPQLASEDDLVYLGLKYKCPAWVLQTKDFITNLINRGKEQIAEPLSQKEARGIKVNVYSFDKRPERKTA